MLIRHQIGHPNSLKIEDIDPTHTFGRVGCFQS